MLGAIAGNVCHRYRIQPLIVTLAMGTIAVGIVQVQDGGTATGSAQAWLATLAEPVTNTFGIGFPPVVAIWIVVAILFWVFLQRTATGRRLFATGANERAAEYALVHTRRVWTLTFAFSAAAAALVGVLIAGYYGGVTSTIGDPYLFGSVVAVIVGGTIFGGPGDYTRTCVGALFVTVLTDGAHRTRRQRADDADRPGRDHPARDHRLRPAAPAERPPMTRSPSPAARHGQPINLPVTRPGRSCTLHHRIINGRRDADVTRT